MSTLDSKILLFDTTDPTTSSSILISNSIIGELAYIQSADVLLAVSANKTISKVEMVTSEYEETDTITFNQVLQMIVPTTNSYIVYLSYSTHEETLAYIDRTNFN